MRMREGAGEPHSTDIRIHWLFLSHSTASHGPKSGETDEDLRATELMYWMSCTQQSGWTLWPASAVTFILPCFEHCHHLLSSPVTDQIWLETRREIAMKKQTDTLTQKTPNRDRVG